MVEVINVPVYCFMVHATSSCLFLVLILWICNSTTQPELTIQEQILWTFVMGRVLVETQQIQRTRMTEYLSSMWNIVDIISLILFVAIIVMRISFYFVFHRFPDSLLTQDNSTYTVYNYVTFQKENNDIDMSQIVVPTIGEYTENDLLAVINIIYSINSIITCTRLLPLFEASYSLGPLQLTMGGMLADLSKIMCLLLTVILAFSLGIAKLYNSRFFYLYVDGVIQQQDNETTDALRALRSIQCLYGSENTGSSNMTCGFQNSYIEPILYKT